MHKLFDLATLWEYLPLRHSYRSWLDATGAAPGVTMDLMRHSAIATTFNVYGRALSPEKREANNRVVELLLAADLDVAR